MLSRVRIITLLLLCFLILPFSARAQIASSATLTSPFTENFPEITTSLKAFNGQGQFVHNLGLGDITILENNRSIGITLLDEQHPGTQFVVALSLERSFGIRDSGGISRYDLITQTFTEWATTQPESASDDLSLVSADGYEAAHLDNADAWLNSLEAYQVDPRTAEPSLDALARAIDIAADPTPRAGMGRSVLFLTPPMSRSNVGTLNSLISRAQQEEIAINIWLVGSPAYFTTEFAEKLAETAAKTGGQFFTYSGVENFPEIDAYLEPLRHIYNLAYQSKIAESGGHQLAAKIEKGNLQITSEPQNFDLEVLPPNPIFISPPQQIVRADRREFSETVSEAEPDYTPKNQEIEILIEFPDGFPRPLVRTSLYVDGQLAAENSAAPFERFTWDLDTYLTSSEHLLQVEAVDALGLSNVTIETPVQVTVQQTPQNIVVSLARNGPLIAGVIAVLAGSILLLVLIIGGRIRPRAFGKHNGNGTTRKARKEAASDPVTQPVQVHPSEPSKNRFSNWVNRFSWPQRRETPEAPAYLEPLNGHTDDPSNRIPLMGNEITIGRDPTKATIAMDDNSIAALHARLRCSESGSFSIQDEGSLAGTWVNYEPAAPEGTKLRHGDIIHVGRVGLYILYSDAHRIPKLKIINLET